MKDAHEMTRREIEHEIERIEAYLEDLHNHPFSDEHAGAEVAGDAGDRSDYLADALRDGDYKMSPRQKLERKSTDELRSMAQGGSWMAGPILRSRNV